MKKPERIYQIEDVLLKIIILLFIFLLPIAIAWLIDEYLLKNLSWFVRYPIWIIVYCISIFLGIILSGNFENAMDRFNKIIGKKTIYKGIKEKNK